MPDEPPETTPQGEVLIRLLPAIAIGFSALASLLFRAAGLSWPKTIGVFIVFSVIMLIGVVASGREESNNRKR
jgi:hypothetical protein